MRLWWKLWGIRQKLFPTNASMVKSRKLRNATEEKVQNGLDNDRFNWAELKLIARIIFILKPNFGTPLCYLKDHHSYKDHQQKPLKIAVPSLYLILFFLSWSQSMWQSATVVETASSRYEFIIMVNHLDSWEWWCIMMLKTMLGWWPKILVRRWNAWRFRVSRMAPPDSSR